MVKKLRKGYGLCQNAEGLSYPPPPAITAFPAFKVNEGNPSSIMREIFVVQC